MTADARKSDAYDMIYPLAPPRIRAETLSRRKNTHTIKYYVGTRYARRLRCRYAVCEIVITRGVISVRARDRSVRYVLYYCVRRVRALQYVFTYSRIALHYCLRRGESASVLLSEEKFENIIVYNRAWQRVLLFYRYIFSRAYGLDGFHVPRGASHNLSRPRPYGQLLAANRRA